jgi:hypothetical protein
LGWGAMRMRLGERRLGLDLCHTALQSARPRHGAIRTGGLSGFNLRLEPSVEPKTFAPIDNRLMVHVHDKSCVSSYSGWGEHMKQKLRKLPVLVAAAFLAGGPTAPAFANNLHPDLHPRVKCNAGIGNGSEVIAGVECDPGNSGANNRAGD